jgi:hypothetical protein
MTIDESDEQSRNAPSPIDERCDPDSNVTAKSGIQAKKQSPPIDITDEGMEIEQSDRQFPKAESPILKR